MVSEDSERIFQVLQNQKVMIAARSSAQHGICKKHKKWAWSLTSSPNKYPQVSLPNQSRYPIPTSSFVSLSLPKAEGKAYHTNSAPSFSSYESSRTKQVVKFPVVQMPKRFLCTKWPRCAGLGFFFRTHATAWHRLWVSHITLLCEKGKQNTQSIGIFLSIITTHPERLRDLSKIAWIRRILGNSQKRRRESRTYESPCKGPRLLEGKEKSYSDPKISSVWKMITLRTNFCLYFPFLQENHQA